MNPASENLHWHQVESTNILAYAYTYTTRTLLVKFNHSDVYQYDQVPLWVAGVLGRSRSKGKAFIKHVRHANYPYRRVV